MLFLTSLLIVVTVIAVFGPVVQFPFLSFDDNEYITENPHVNNGLHVGAVLWAFTHAHAANWHPLTWVSHMLDVELFGLNAGPHHAVNVLLHALNALLVFLFLVRTTRAPWKALLCALLFALHPLRAESVAWVAERKDLLCGVFWWGTLLAHVRYIEAPSMRRRLVVGGLCACAMLSKPMAVTLPLALMLTEYWPLGRKPAVNLRGRSELFVLSALLVVVTFVAQRAGGAVRDFALFPLGIRLENAPISYVLYLKRALWPAGLGPIYPYPAQGYPAWEVAACVVLLLLITGIAWRLRGKTPALWMGWLWYLITLLPVIGLVQVGYQASADRYTYLPLVGPVMGVVYSVPSMASRARPLRGAIAVGLALLLAISAALTYRQTTYWSDSARLFERALAVTKDNDIAENELGLVYLQRNQLGRAANHLREALRINPAHYAAWANLGVVLRKQGQLEEALRHGEEAVRLAPDFLPGYNGLGLTYAAMKRYGEAERMFRLAIERDPDYVAARINLVQTLVAMGNTEEAKRQAEAVLRLDPSNPYATRMLTP